MKVQKVLYLSKEFPLDHPMYLRWKSYYTSVGIKVLHRTTYWNFYSTSPIMKVKALLEWMLFIKLHNISFIHVNDLETALLACHLQRKFGIKYIFDAHEIFSHEVPESHEHEFQKKVKLQVEDVTMKYAAAIIIPNQQRIDYLKSIHPDVPNEKFCLIENKSLRQGDGQPVDDLYISKLPKQRRVFFGGSFWHARKQEVFPQLANALRHHDLGLVVSGGNNEYLKGLLAQSENMHYVGYMPYNQYDDFIDNHIDIGLAWYYPSTVNDELMAPVKVFDYLRALKPVVAPSLPYFVELSGKYPEAIILFKTGDWEDCLEKILEVDQNDYTLKVNDDYTWESQYSKINSLLLRNGFLNNKTDS